MKYSIEFIAWFSFLSKTIGLIVKTFLKLLKQYSIWINRLLFSIQWSEILVRHNHRSIANKVFTSFKWFSSVKIMSHKLLNIFFGNNSIIIPDGIFLIVNILLSLIWSSTLKMLWPITPSLYYFQEPSNLLSENYWKKGIFLMEIWFVKKWSGWSLILSSSLRPKIAYFHRCKLLPNEFSDKIWEHVGLSSWKGLLINIDLINVLRC